MTRTPVYQNGLYDPFYEHDNCGVGFVVNINGDKTHEIVTEGITILKNLSHRGAVGGDSTTGDGAGILVQIPYGFLKRECGHSGFSLPEAGRFGVAMLFLPRDERLRVKAYGLVEDTISELGGFLLGFRDVPVSPECLGETARSSMPHIAQVFISFPELEGDDLERRLYMTRKSMRNAARRLELPIERFYVPSCSSRTIVYKGLFVAPQLESFYPDLADGEFTSAFSMVHQRYSTNTFPSWPLAQPFRYIAHNGEINTLRGNINKMNARQMTLKSDRFGDEISKIFPIVDMQMSDSGMFDNVFELLVADGRSVEHAMTMMIPEAFGTRYHISEDKRAYYEYHAAIMEPWDGPAAITFTDGIRIGATLDRNGLRPSRYTITKGGKVVVASETGVLDIPPNEILAKGRLAPGKIFMIDTSRKRILYDNEIKASVSRRKPYRRWLENNRIELKALFKQPGPVEINQEELRTRSVIFGYTFEDIKMILKPMAENGQEPVGSMGNDSALAVLSARPQLLYNYFKQLFAQVTNPPIDPYRENLVMSLMSFVGRERNLLDETPEHCNQLKLPHPILSNDDMTVLKTLDRRGYRSSVLSALFNSGGDENEMETAMRNLCTQAEKMIDEGCSLIVLTDRETDRDHAPIPSLLAVAAVHQHLVRCKKRHLTGLVVETGEAREVMHIATLIGFGASAVNPYMAFELIAALKESDQLPETMRFENACENYITSLKKGLLKIMSKMGVSTIRSYRSAQLFEAVGLNNDFIAKYFPGTSSRIGGIGMKEIAAETLTRHREAFTHHNNGYSVLESGGEIHYRKFSQQHLMSPDAIALVQKAIRTGDYAVYKQFSGTITDVQKNLCTLRGLFKFRGRPPVALDEVEPDENIIKRFVSSAMSFGSISKEAHETIAVAMNRLGAQSNSGEGGEDEVRYTPLPNGDSKASAVKQVASGRFGVDIGYLINARELQIKMAQGAKPGEGGQLPGHKVNEEIAKVRHSTPGVMLISPPPHHDIYSIEDLAQLIYDLKNANSDARISVKLVSEVGVGTVAAGVAKGKADMVLISGHDGGTGASPISSIKHAGIPWEIGLAETQQTLVLNRLRSRIRVQVDGQIKTGRDVVIAALLGAEEYGFGTMSLVSMGCIYMRKCHLNTCPVGVATQDPVLRERFRGEPEHLINYMKFVARETREIMAELGFRTMDEMIGRVECLDVNKAVSHWKTEGLDFSRLLAPPGPVDDAILRCTEKQIHDFSQALDEGLIEECRPALEEKKPVRLSRSIRNFNRTVGTILSSAVCARHGARGLPPDTIHCKFTGSAGQSFGAFLAHGITFELEGDANDYFGKGLSGGRLIVYPSRKSTFRARNNIITGNVNLFGATSGEVYINGMAGERFAVRNSGAVAVVEGLGDHGCEYMTGGTIAVLGKVGVNFAAGMSGGIAFILDEDQLFDTKCNLEMVDLEPVTDEEDCNLLHRLINDHVRYTGSEHASRILRDWTEMLPHFVKVMPQDYKRALMRIKERESKETETVTMTEEVFR